MGTEPSGKPLLSRNRSSGEAGPRSYQLPALPEGTECRSRLVQEYAVPVSQKQAEPLLFRRIPGRNARVPARPGRNRERFLPPLKIQSFIPAAQEEKSGIQAPGPSGVRLLQSSRNNESKPLLPDRKKVAVSLRLPVRQEADTVLLQKGPGDSELEVPARPGGNCLEVQFPEGPFQRTAHPESTPVQQELPAVLPQRELPVQGAGLPPRFSRKRLRLLSLPRHRRRAVPP